VSCEGELILLLCLELDKNLAVYVTNDDQWKVTDTCFDRIDMFYFQASHRKRVHVVKAKDVLVSNAQYKEGCVHVGVSTAAQSQPRPSLDQFPVHLCIIFRSVWFYVRREKYVVLPVRSSLVGSLSVDGPVRPSRLT
jgi:hypothetical protein